MGGGVHFFVKGACLLKSPAHVWPYARQRPDNGVSVAGVDAKVISITTCVTDKEQGPTNVYLLDSGFV